MSDPEPDAAESEVGSEGGVVLTPTNGRWPEVFAALPRIAAGTDAFFAESGTAIWRIEPGPEWNRYAEQARRIHVDTEQFFAALDMVAGSDSGRVRRDREAAVQAFDWFDAESAERREEGLPEVEALVATQGDRLIGVTVFRETGDALEVFAEGNTRPPGRDARSARLALQYALARSAAHAGYEIREIMPDRTRDNSDPTTYGWSAAEARLVAREIAHPGDNARLPELTVSDSPRWEHFAGQISEYLETGGRVRAVRHSAPAGRMPERLDGQTVVELARLAGEPRSDSTADALFSPSGDQDRDLVTLVAEHQGVPVATLTYGEADGELRVVHETGSFETDRGAIYSLRSSLATEAARHGLGMTYQREDGPEPVSSVQAAVESDMMRGLVGPRHSLIAPRLRPDVPGAELSEVLRRVSNFDRGGGDVIVLPPDTVRFDELRNQIVGRLADDGQPTPPYLARALAPPMTDQSYANLTRVAVATRNGEPTAVVRFHVRLSRVELDAAVAVPGAGTPADVAAAVVDGPMRAARGRPLSGAVPPEVARLYTGAGIGLDERSRLGAVPGLVIAEVDGPAARKVVEAQDGARGGTPSRDDLEAIASDVKMFRGTRCELAVLDHADPEDRRRVEWVYRQDLESVADLEVPGDDRDRFTVVALEGDSALAFMTVDATPQEPLTVIAAGDSVMEPSEPPIQWWLTNHAVAVDRHVVLSDPVNRHLAGDRADQRTAHWTIPELKRTILGVRNRTGDRPDRLLAGVGEARPRVNPEAVPLPKPPPAAERGDAGPGIDRSGWERRDRPDPPSAGLGR